MTDDDVFLPTNEPLTNTKHNTPTKTIRQWSIRQWSIRNL